MTNDPIKKFIDWLEDAERCEAIIEPTAMALATANAKGRPSVRMVLLKGVDASGFVFYTNMESRKGLELSANPHASLCFYWPQLDRQVRVDGRVEIVGSAEADAYFDSRPRESCIGAWASKQSQPLADREDLVQAVAQYTEKFGDNKIPRPPYWSGWRLIPETIEFWHEGEARLHDREVHTRAGEGWTVKKLYP